MGEPIVFFDIDGTLLNEEKQLPVSTKNAIYKLKQNGIRTAIATGRGPFMFEELREELGIDTFVSYNGQYAEAEGELVYHFPLQADALAELERRANEHGHPMVFMGKQRMCSNRDFHPRIDESIRTLKVEMPANVPEVYKQEHIYQALLFCTDEEEKLYESAREHFRFIRWHEFSIDVLNTGISKAYGIRTLVERLGLAMEDVYAFGDALNDIEMLEHAGTGVAMGNAADEVKQAAKWVTRSVSEDGIEYGLKHFGLI